jgi:hypothetical protein
MYAYGLHRNGQLVGVCTYGKPASRMLCKHICGDQYSKNVFELNRLVLMHNLKNEASRLIGRSLKLLPHNSIIVSYADSAQDHIGYIYQATNWLYIGATRQRTDMIGKDGKHARHYNKGETQRVVRSSKHRYVTFTGNKRQKRILRDALKYEVMEYPKSQSVQNCTE